MANQAVGETGGATSGAPAAPPAADAGTPPSRPRLYRLRHGRVAAGVAAGLAAHLGLPVLAVRLAFVVLLAFNGLGLVLYAVFWAVVPISPHDGGRRTGRDVVLLLPFAAVAVAVIVIRIQVGGGGDLTAAVGWLVALIAVGAGIIWHQTTGDTRRRGGEPIGTPWLGALLTENDRRTFLLRFVGGGLLVVIGVIGLAAAYAPTQGASLTAVIYGLTFALLALAGVGLVTAPVLWRTFGALRSEREARIREQERAEFAAMVHDQVLHTLALIQRSAPTGSDAHRLARSQERSLRGWLYRPSASPSEKLGAALEQAAAEVEDTYGVTVEVVMVGDLDTDDQSAALVAAAREAMVNAARHAQVSTVSLYGEVEPEQVSVFIRDRGVGFDPEAVDPERHGVKGSVVGRMERHGGQADIISSPGEGTEIRLRLPRSADRKEGTA